jgi:hypothetical protein
VPVPGTMIACTAVSPREAVTAVVSDCIAPMIKAVNAVKIATMIDFANDRPLFRITLLMVVPRRDPAIAMWRGRPESSKLMHAKNRGSGKVAKTQVD